MKVPVGGRNTHLIEFGDCAIKVVKAKISDKLRIPPEQHAPTIVCRTGTGR